MSAEVGGGRGESWCAQCLVITGARVETPASFCFQASWFLHHTVLLLPHKREESPGLTSRTSCAVDLCFLQPSFSKLTMDPKYPGKSALVLKMSGHFGFLVTVVP